MNDAHLLAEHLGCTDQKCIEDALALIKDNHKSMVQLNSDDEVLEIDDNYADSEENTTICQWSSEAPEWKYPSFKYKIWNTSCMVIQMPPDPYPDGVDTWK